MARPTASTREDNQELERCILIVVVGLTGFVVGSVSGLDLGKGGGHGRNFADGKMTGSRHVAVGLSIMSVSWTLAWGAQQRQSMW